MLTASVIGCGHGGGLSLEALGHSNNFVLRAAADPSADARREVARRFPEAHLFANHRDMLADCAADVVCVATPAPTHEPIAREVLRHGVRGLLLEKPIACDAVTAERLLNEIRAAECPLVVPHGMLVLPAAQEIKSLIRAGDIGDVTAVGIQNAVDLMNAGIHWLAYVIDIFDTDGPAAISAEFDVSGHMVNDSVQVESRGETHIELASGIRIDLYSGHKTEPGSDVLPQKEQKGALFRVTGSLGVIEFSAWAGSYWIQLEKSKGELIRRPLESDQSYHRIFLEQLAQSIADGVADYSSADLSLAALRVIETAYQAQVDGDWPLGVPAST